MHKQSDDSAESFPTLRKLSIPCSPLFPIGHSATHWYYCTPMENTEEHTGGSSRCDTGTETSTPKIKWASVPKKWDPKDKAVIEKLGLTKLVHVCKDNDEKVALEAIANYNEATKKTTIQGLTVELNVETVARAFSIDRDPFKKENPLSDVAISKYLNETYKELKDRRKKK